MKTTELTAEKVRIHLPAQKDKRFKSWRKILTGVDKTKSDGYAFLGEFISPYQNKDIEIELGTYILVYDEVGSVKHHSPEVFVYRVDGEFQLTELFCSYSWNWALDLRDEVAKLFEDNEAKKEKLTIEKEALLKRLDEINAFLEAIENENQ